MNWRGVKMKARTTPARLLAGEMNRDELEYSRHLELRKQAGEIADWRFQQIKFRLADNTYYTPDFIVVRFDASMEIHEYKGFWEDDARVKFKVVNELFPYFTWIAVTRKNKSSPYEYEVLK